MRNQNWMGENNKALAIVRVSSYGQKDNISHDVQEREIREYCANNGLRVIDIVKIVESAKDSDNRKKYGLAVNRALTESVQHLLFYMYDREARNLTDNEKNEKLVKAGLIVLHYVRENKILHRDSPDSEFFIRDVQAAANKQFIRNLSAKVNDAMREKAQRGWYPSNNPPLGYVNLKSKDSRGKEMKRGGTIDLDPDERKLRQVQMEFTLRAQGYSYQEIRDKIVQEGIIDPSQVRHYRACTIQKRIINPFYRGRFIWQGQEYDGKHPVFIPKHILERVDAVEGGRKFLPRDAQHGFFGGAWIRCAECGCNIIYEPKIKRYRNGTSTTFHLYHCTNGRKFHPTLKGLYIEEKALWAQFDAAVDMINLTPSLASQIADALNQSQERVAAQARRRIDECQREMDALTAKEDQMLEHLLANIIDQASYKRKVQLIRDERRMLQDALTQAKTQLRGKNRENLNSILELCKNSKSLYLSRSLSERREFLEMILSNPRLNGRTLEYDLKKPFRTLSMISVSEEWRALIDDFRTDLSSLQDS